MSDIDAGSAAPAPAEQDTSIAVPVESPAPAVTEEQTDAPKFIKPSQGLTDRYKKQFDRLYKIHARLVQLKGDVVAVPAAKPRDIERPVKPVPFFGALAMVADSNDAVILAIEEDLKDLEELF